MEFAFNVFYTCMSSTQSNPVLLSLCPDQLNLYLYTALVTDQFKIKQHLSNHLVYSSVVYLSHTWLHHLPVHLSFHQHLHFRLLCSRQHWGYCPNVLPASCRFKHKVIQNQAQNWAGLSSGLVKMASLWFSRPDILTHETRLLEMSMFVLSRFRSMSFPKRDTWGCDEQLSICLSRKHTIKYTHAVLLQPGQIHMTQLQRDISVHLLYSFFMYMYIIQIIPEQVIASVYCSLAIDWKTINCQLFIQQIWFKWGFELCQQGGKNSSTYIINLIPWMPCFHGILVV